MKYIEWPIEKFHSLILFAGKHGYKPKFCGIKFWPNRYIGILIFEEPSRK